MRGRSVINLKGRVFGRLKIVKYSGISNKNATWECVCECGARTTAYACHLKSGRMVSCGCHRREVLREKAKTHGLSRTPTYIVWKSMMQRCRDPKSSSYANYGGRGVSICKRWLRFENFLEDMGVRPPGLSLERKDNDGNYSKSNCRWATAIDQANNTRRNRFVSRYGKRLTVAQWERELGVRSGLIQLRLQRGWSPSRALTATIL